MASGCYDLRLDQLANEVRYHKRAIRQHREALHIAKSRYKKMLAEMGINFVEVKKHHDKQDAGSAR